MPSYSNFLSSLVMIPRQVNLPRVCYPGELISSGYDNPASQSLWSIIPRRVNKKSAKTWLPRISYPGKSIYCIPGYQTPVSQFFSLKFLITRGNLNQNQKYFKPFWGSPKADSNNEKNESRKSRLTVPVGGVITLVQQPYLFFY